jgi:ribosomal protein S18 acetylase RimI-like enzyme
VASDDAPVLRPASDDDVEVLAVLWHDGWCDGHLADAPAVLLKDRTLDVFRARTKFRLGDMTVATVGGTVAGFVIVTDDEVEQVYVDRAFRGTAVAKTVLREGERRVGEQGYDEAWLAVVNGNERARAFYTREGWVDEGLQEYDVPATDPPLVWNVHRYTKRLG